MKMRKMMWMRSTWLETRQSNVMYMCIFYPVQWSALTLMLSLFWLYLCSHSHEVTYTDSFLHSSLHVFTTLGFRLVPCVYGSKRCLISINNMLKKKLFTISFFCQFYKFYIFSEIVRWIEEKALEWPLVMSLCMFPLWKRSVVLSLYL